VTTRITGTSKNQHFIPTGVTTRHSTKPPKNGAKVAGYAVLRQKGKQASGTAEFSRALLTIPHGMLLPVADRRPLAGHLGEV
jgi:hypothetical protein